LHCVAFVGHCARIDQSVARALLYQAPGLRRSRKQRTSFVDTFTKSTGTQHEKLTHLMANRDQWRVIVKTTEKCVKGKKPAIEKGYD
jgi:hypothetical protein